MSDTSSRLPPRPSLEQLRRRAKELLKELRSGTASAVARLRQIPARRPSLADAQFVIAREHGFETWAKLVRHLDEVKTAGRLERAERLAGDLVAAWNGDEGALARVNELAPRPLSADGLRASVRERLAPDVVAGELPLDQARLLVARLHGFATWGALAESLVQPAADPRAAPHGLTASPPFYRIDWQRNLLELQQPLVSDRDWDAVLVVMRDLRLAGLAAGGQMTDAVMARLPALEHLTHLDLGGARRLTDDGLRHLAGMPQLEELDLSGSPRDGRITDRGLASLGHLGALRRVALCWQPGISDAGVAALAACQRLERVDLLGTPTGDGAIAALAGKPALTYLKTGRQVTDAGLPRLRDFPAFARWPGGTPRYQLMSPDAGPTHLLLDGPFTDQGLGALAGLDGLFGFSIFWHSPAVTSDGLGALAALPRLGFLGCEGTLCDDRAMEHIATFPALRMLMAQGTVASDDGFAALARSRTLEHLWGRECPNLGGRGFAALAGLPALRGLAVSCRGVDDAALAALPRFPALAQLMPMDVRDDGFRHVGGCGALEDLWCMYCRDTGDAATAHLAGLPRLRTYYAGKTRITDRSLEILAGLTTLERLELWQCAGITGAGLAALAGLPHLRELIIAGSPQVTREAAAAFPARVSVSYSA